MAQAKPTLSDYSLLILVAAIFGGSFVLIAQALETIPVLSLVAGRLILALVIMLVIMRFVGQSLPAIGIIWISITASALFGNALPFFLITLGQKNVDAGLAAILIAVMPLSTIVLAHFFTGDEKLNRYKFIGIVLGFAGTVLLVGVDKLASFGENTLGQLAILAAAVCYSTNALLVKSMARLPRYSTISGVLLVSVLLVLPLAILQENPWQLEFSTNSILALLMLGVVATAFGNFLRFEIAKRQGAVFLSQNNYFMPLFGVFWAWLFLSEQPPANSLIALALILAGIAVSRISNNRVVKA